MGATHQLVIQHQCWAKSAATAAPFHCGDACGPSTKASCPRDVLEENAVTLDPGGVFAYATVVIYTTALEIHVSHYPVAAREGVYPHFAYPRVIEIGVVARPRVLPASAVLFEEVDKRERTAVTDEGEEGADVGCRDMVSAALDGG